MIEVQTRQLTENSVVRGHFRKHRGDAPSVEGGLSMRLRLMSLISAALILFVSRPASSQEWVEFSSQEERITCVFPAQPKVTETMWISEYGAVLPARVYSATQGQ